MFVSLEMCSCDNPFYVISWKYATLAGDEARTGPQFEYSYRPTEVGFVPE